MKCEKCGANLSLKDKNCPYCGTLNEAARQHISDMNKYEREFKQTRWHVIQNSKWFSKYNALLLAIVLVVIANATLVVLKSSNATYYMDERRMKVYNQVHNNEIQKQIKELMEQGEYFKVQSMYQYYNKIYENDYSKWSTFYTMAYDQQEIYNSFMYSMNRSKDISYKNSSWISRASEAIHNFYDAFNRRSNYNNAEEDVSVYLDDMCNQVNDFLYVYGKCSEQDVKKIASSDQTQIASILIRRLIDE